MKLSKETLARHACRNRDRCAKRQCEKGDARRYPIHTLAPNDDEPELPLEKPDDQDD